MKDQKNTTQQGNTPAQESEEQVSVYVPPPKPQKAPKPPKKDFKLETNEEMQKTAEYLIQNKLVPSSLKEPQHVFMALHTCNALGFKTFGEATNALKEMYILNGQVHIFGSLPMSLVQKTGLLEDIEEFLTDENGEKICSENKNLNAKPMAAICRMKRKGMSWNEFVVTEEDLIQSGGRRNPDGSWTFKRGQKDSYTWKAYYKLHWRYRARSMGIKCLFPDAVKNIAITDQRTNFTRIQPKQAENSQIEAQYNKKDLNKGNMDVKLTPPNINQKED